MVNVYFRGRVFPERFKLTTDDLPYVTWHNPDMAISTTIRDGKFEVRFATEAEHLNEMFDLLIRAETIIASAVDLASFINGVPFHAVIETFTGTDGKPKHIRIHDAELKTIMNVGKPGYAFPTFESAYRVLIKKVPHTFFALNDLAASLRAPLNSAVNAGRAVDTIRNLMAPGKDKPEGWKKLSERLNLSPSYVRYITNASIPVRHGDHGQRPSGAVQRETQIRAWTIMARYMEYLARDEKPLPLDKFPVL